MPRDHCQPNTAGQIAEFMPMFGLSLHGVNQAIAVLPGRSSLEFPLFAGSGKFQDKLIEETMRKE